MSCDTVYNEDNYRLLYTCSGCCDAGLASDMIGRRLRKEGYAKCGSSCLAGVAADVKPFINKVLEAPEVICIDGCGVRCATKVIKKLGLKPRTFELTQMGLVNSQNALDTNCVDYLMDEIVEQLKCSNL